MEKKLLFLAFVILVVVWSLWYFKLPPFGGIEGSPVIVVEEQVAVPADVGEEIPENAVIIKENTFFPQTVVVSKGTTITFINRDSIQHSATAEDKSFDTGLLGKDAQKQVAFDNAGTFAYICAVDPNMHAVIVVKK